MSGYNNIIQILIKPQGKKSRAKKLSRSLQYNLRFTWDEI